MRFIKISVLFWALLSVCYSAFATNFTSNSTSTVPLPADCALIKAPMVSTPMNPICGGMSLQLMSQWTGVEAVSYSWIGPNNFSSHDANPTIMSASAAASGVYILTVMNVSGCTSSAWLNVIVSPTPIITPPLVTVSMNLCEDQTVVFTSTAVSGANYMWTGPNNFSSTLQNPMRPNIKLHDQGVYSLTVTRGGCSASTQTSYLVVRPRPAMPIVYANPAAVLCVGQMLNLTTDAVGMTQYKWTGPNGFTYMGAYPPAMFATPANAGVYSLTTTLNNCASNSPGMLAVSVNMAVPSAAPFVWATQTSVCMGQSIHLNGPTVPGAMYIWTGPNNFVSNQQNPTIMNATSNASGVYMLRMMMGGGCASNQGMTAYVNVVPAPMAPMMTINPPMACLGQPVSFSTPYVANATYQWTGPGGFYSTAQNPMMNVMSANRAGVYTLTITTMGNCQAVMTNTLALGTTLPNMPTVSYMPNMLCLGQTLNLNANSYPGALYMWTGPNGYVSAAQNPTIFNFTTTMNGMYYLTVQSAGCTATTSLFVMETAAAPPKPTANVSSLAVCPGGSLGLTTNAYNVTYHWTGPGGFFSAMQNPSLAISSTSMSGAYSLTVTNADGCTASAISTYVAVGMSGVGPPQAVSTFPAGSNSSNVVFNGWMGVSMYRIGYRIKGAGNWSFTPSFVPTSLGAGQYMYPVTGLQSGSTYQFVVEGASPCGGYTGPSNMVEGPTMNGESQVCMTPNDMYADVTGPTTTVIGFQMDAGPYSCMVISYGPQTQSPLLWSNVTFMTGVSPNAMKNRLITGLMSNTTYGYRMRTNCSANCSLTQGIFSGWSPVMTFRTTSAREADTFTEQTKAPQFSLYPNPSQGNFTLSFEAETTDSRLVEILDMTGRSILKQSYDVVPGKNEISFDLTARPHGVYLLKTDTYSAKILVE